MTQVPGLCQMHLCRHLFLLSSFHPFDGDLKRVVCVCVSSLSILSFKNLFMYFKDILPFLTRTFLVLEFAYESMIYFELIVTQAWGPL